MYKTLPAVKQLTHCSQDALADLLAEVDYPLVIKGLVSDWPVVKAALSSDQAVADYLLDYANPMQIGAGRVPAKENGRLFYNETFSEFNFERYGCDFNEFLETILSTDIQINTDGHYMGSTHVDRLLPGFRQHNDIHCLEGKSALASIWISNKTQIAPHQDFPSNLACCVAGKRRFTLFPPEEINNLYIGPLDLTPAGQPISLVNLQAPDFNQFPKFETALSNASVAELEPGDALFLPSMWWHAVESLTPFNILINYWWQETASHMGAPMDALWHALLNINALPTNQKQAVKALFDFYIFNKDQEALTHIPSEALGILDKNSELAARQIRTMLLNKLNR
jgi:Cupin-like domain